MNDGNKLKTSKIKESKIQPLNEKELTDINNKISKEEISDVIDILNTRKAAGHDGTTNLMIKMGGVSTVNLFVEMFNKIFNEGIYPNCWNKAIIILIPKKKKILSILKTSDRSLFYQ